MIKSCQLTVKTDAFIENKGIWSKGTRELIEHKVRAKQKYKLSMVSVLFLFIFIVARESSTMKESLVYQKNKTTIARKDLRVLKFLTASSHCYVWSLPVRHPAIVIFEDLKWMNNLIFCLRTCAYIKYLPLNIEPSKINTHRFIYKNQSTDDYAFLSWLDSLLWELNTLRDNFLLMGRYIFPMGILVFSFLFFSEFVKVLWNIEMDWQSLVTNDWNNLTGIIIN